ncbi:MAG: thiol:disulfide interchange protein DsbG [Pseudomonas sp.]
MKRFPCVPLLLASLGLLSVSSGVALAAELPAAIQAVEARGAKIVGRFDAPNGLQGFAARYNGQGMALYLTADGQHVLLGTLLDAKGEDLSREPLERLVYAPMGEEMLTRMQDSTWIADGSDSAPRVVYVFSDPNCPYCNLFWKQARPWVDAGKVQLRHIMVGMLRADSAAKAAALLTAKQPAAALNEHERAGKASTLKPMKTIAAEVQQQLDDNLALMGELGAAATPAIFYQDADGRLQQQQGAPNADNLTKIMGPK